MIQTHSTDPDLGAAALIARKQIDDCLSNLPKSTTYDYGGHQLSLGDYDVCMRCTTAIAEAQQAHSALLRLAEASVDDLVTEHILLAADLFRVEAEVAEIRAKFHNGHHTEQILNTLLGFIYDRKIQEDFDHSHHKGE